MATHEEDVILDQQQDQIRSVQEQMARCQALTQQMMGVLDSFENKLTSLESAMMPIHQNTVALTTAQRNFDKTLAQVDLIIQHWEVANEPSSAILNRHIESDYRSYIAWVKRVIDAKHFFEKNSAFKNSDKALKSLREFANKAEKDCNAECRRILAAYERSIPWKKLQDREVLTTFELISAREVQQLRDIYECLTSMNPQNDFIRILQASRSAAVRASLKEAYNKDASDEAGDEKKSAAFGAPSGGASAGSQQATRYQRGSHRLLQFTDNLVLLLQLESQLCYRVLSHSNYHLGRDNDHFIEWQDVLYDIADSAVEYYQKKAELVVKDKSGNKLLILLDLLGHLIQLFPTLKRLLERSPGNHDKGTSESGFQRLQSLHSQYVAAVRKSLVAYAEYIEHFVPPKSVTSSKQASKDGTISTLTIEVVSFIKLLIEYKPIIDATRTEFGNLAALYTTSSGTASLHALPTDADEKDIERLQREREQRPLTSHMLWCILGALEANLDQKSKTFKEVTLAHIFLLNNLHYVLKVVRSTEILLPSSSSLSTLDAGGTSGNTAPAPLASGRMDSMPDLFLPRLSDGGGPALDYALDDGADGGTDGNALPGAPLRGRSVHVSLSSELGEPYMKALERAIARERQEYLRSTWDKVLNILDLADSADILAKTKPIVQPTAKKIIKGKFAAFNTLFEQIYNTQRQYSVPDSEVRSQLRNENAERLLPAFRAFLEKYAPVEFSSHRRSYDKYDPQTLENMLQQFFDEFYIES